MFTNKKKISFSDSVEVIYWLLSIVNEKHWISHFQNHRNGNIDGFRSVFGGMGSFNDLILCRANGHSIDEEKEPLANELLNCLSSIAYTASIEGDLTKKEAISSCGNMGSELSGWRCRDCGYGEITPRSIYGFTAYHDVRKAIENGIKTGSVPNTIKSVWNEFNGKDKVDRFKNYIQASEIYLSQNTGWMRPCPKCNSEDTCVYRWNFNGCKFVPAADNLQIRKR